MHAQDGSSDFKRNGHCKVICPSVHKDLNLQCFKKKRAQELTESNKLTRLTRAKQLLKKYPEHAVGFIWFTDEKLFTVAPPINLHNDRLYAPIGMKKRAACDSTAAHSVHIFKVGNGFSRSVCSGLYRADFH